MGLLDDAIREHLDLKRRRGADPAEIERAEREALGPVRRGQDEPEHDGLDHEVAYEEGVAYDHEADAGAEQVEARWHEVDTEWDEAFEEDHVVGPPQDGLSLPGPELEHERPAVHEPPEPLAEEDSADLHGEQPIAAARGSEPAAPPPHPAPATHPGEQPGEETAEYDVESDQDAREDGEDMLEETPEFLQDAPDHDRLWFEQRPPRDFDFDE
jgi:hypothetical protein